MKHVVRSIAALALSALAHTAHAGLLNDTVKVDYLYPNINTTYRAMFEGTVTQAGVTMAYLENVQLFTLRLTDDRLRVEFNFDETWEPTAFNGIALTDLSDSLGPVQIGAATNLAGFGANSFSVVDNILYINWQGLSFNRQTLLELEFEPTQSEVPEPLSLGLLGLGLAGLGASRRLRK